MGCMALARTANSKGQATRRQPKDALILARLRHRRIVAARTTLSFLSLMDMLLPRDLLPKLTSMTGYV